MIFDYIAANWMEVLGLVSGLLCVWLLIKENIWTFPIGLFYALITVVIVFQAQLYADVVLNIYYVVVNAYGWYFWRCGGAERRDEQELKVGLVSKVQVRWLVLIIAFGTLLMGWLFVTYTDAELAYTDYDDITLTGSADTDSVSNKVDADVDATSLRLSVGKAF